jgi:hypothetical protein
VRAWRAEIAKATQICPSGQRDREAMPGQQAS